MVPVLSENFRLACLVGYLAHVSDAKFVEYIRIPRSEIRNHDIGAGDVRENILHDLASPEQFICSPSDKAYSRILKSHSDRLIRRTKLWSKRHYHKAIARFFWRRSVEELSRITCHFFI